MREMEGNHGHRFQVTAPSSDNSGEEFTWAESRSDWLTLEQAFGIATALCGMGWNHVRILDMWRNGMVILEYRSKQPILY